MKQFNLEEYLENPSKQLVTRDGRIVKRILCTDAKSKYPIVALIESKDKKDEYPLRYTVNGQYCPDYETPEDLFFNTEKHEGWVNVYKGEDRDYFTLGAMIYDRKEDAERCCVEDCVATTKIEWEE